MQLQETLHFVAPEPLPSAPPEPLGPACISDPASAPPCNLTRLPVGVAVARSSGPTPCAHGLTVPSHASQPHAPYLARSEPQHKE